MRVIYIISHGVLTATAQSLKRRHNYCKLAMTPSRHTTPTVIRTYILCPACNIRDM